MAYDYPHELGGLITNFQSLEFVLRAFLQDRPSARPIGLPSGTDLYTFPVGSKVPESELTSYDSLLTLILKANKELANLGGRLIDETLVQVRDALAHGRVASMSDDQLIKLVKYSPANAGTVVVTFNETLSQEWFTIQKKRTREAFYTIHPYLKGN